MVDTHLPTPAASSSTSPTALDSADKKRPRDSTTSTTNKTPATKKAKAEGTNGDVHTKETKGVFCHQRVERYLKCTSPTCTKVYCDSDLQRRYETAVSDFVDDSTEITPEHQNYDWTCPHCRGVCQTDTCRKRAGREPLGRNYAKEDGQMVSKPAGEKVKGKGKGKGKDKAKEDGAAIPVTPESSGSKPKAKKARASAATMTKSPDTADRISTKKKTKKEPKVDSVPRASASSGSLSPPPAIAAGPKPHDPTKKQRPSHAFSLDSDSSLTDEEVDGSKPGEPSGPKTKVKQNSKVGAKPAKKGDGKVKSKLKDAGGKVKTPVKGEKGKSINKGVTKEGEKKVRAKPVKKPEVAVEPPVFEKVDTRLGRVEAEHRIMLREYLCRFRAVLSIPERSLPALDDFDRPPTDASVRLFTGAMLDLIKEDLQEGDAEEEIIEIVDKYREELRYYADLARFANAYKQLEDPLDLRLPKTVLPSTSGQANATAVRNLLGLPANESLPDWAVDAGPARRTAASRLPSNDEVIRMLLAFAERTFSTPALRADLVWEAPENEARRVHARELKKENEDWAKVKKGLMTAALQAKSAAATKANKEKMTNETKEHNLRLSLANVNLRAALALRAPRHEALGTDLDGRSYYCLTQRAIDDDSRAPIGWASGLLVWGIGLPPKANMPIDEDDLPIMMERWCHFGQSADVKQLVKWVDYRTRKAVEEARKLEKPARPKTPNGKTSTSKATPNGKGKASLAGTPSKQTTLNFGLPSSSAKPSPAKRSILEVVIPVTKASRASSEDGSMSELSDLSSDDEELLSHLAPEGYKASADLIEENGKDLARKLGEVAEWLEVLEWKGMGEIVK